MKRLTLSLTTLIALFFVSNPSVTMSQAIIQWNKGAFSLTTQANYYDNTTNTGESPYPTHKYVVESMLPENQTSLVEIASGFEGYSFVDVKKENGITIMVTAFANVPSADQESFAVGRESVEFIGSFISKHPLRELSYTYNYDIYA